MGLILSKLFCGLFDFYIYKAPKKKKRPHTNTENSPLSAIMKLKWKANTLSMDRGYPMLLFVAAKWQR